MNTYALMYVTGVRLQTISADELEISNNTAILKTDGKITGCVVMQEGMMIGRLRDDTSSAITPHVVSSKDVINKINSQVRRGARS